MTKLQQQFLQQIKDKLPADESFVDLLAEELHVSSDSAYRRMRGDTDLTFEETTKLALKFGLSIDDMIGNPAKSITFHYDSFDGKFTFKKYLQGILAQLEQYAGHQNPSIIYSAKDIPLFQLFNVPELASFKIFFWAKSIVNIPEFEKRSFSVQDLDDSVRTIGRKIINHYISIPTTEIWNLETVSSLIKQVEFYAESGLFSSQEDGLILMDKIKDLIGHVKSQAELGNKYLFGLEPIKRENNYVLYFNEILIPENMILVKLGDAKVSYISHNVLNYLTTHSALFAKDTEAVLETLKQKSTLISVASEKERNKFFNKCLAKAEQAKKQIELM